MAELELPSSHQRRAGWKTIVSIAVLILVGVGVTHTVWKAREKFRAQQFDLSGVSWAWLALAGALYLLGSLASWFFWHRTLVTMGQRPRMFDTLRAFFLGHLGKYVPGKAMVVVLRAALAGPTVDFTVAALSVFVETMTLMAVGAMVAALMMLVAKHDEPRLLFFAVGFMVCAGVPLWPPLFRKLVRIVGTRRLKTVVDAIVRFVGSPRESGDLEQAIQRLDARLMLTGWLVISIGWLLHGLSLWATLRALPAESVLADLSNPLEHLPLLTAAVALAVVAGFVSFLPGGVGVRELVVMTLLAQPYGEVAAIVSAALLRVTWLAAEFGISAVLCSGLLRRNL